MSAHAYNFTLRDGQIRLALVDFAKARVKDKLVSRALLKLSKSAWSYPSLEYKVIQTLGRDSQLLKTWDLALQDTRTDPLGTCIASTSVDLFKDLVDDRSDSFGEFLIDSVEIPILLFDHRNDQEDLFHEGMGAEQFVKTCLINHRTTPFAIHFLRQLDAHLFVTFGRPHNKTLLRYPRLVRFPLDGSREPRIADGLPATQKSVEPTLTTQSVELKNMFASITRDEIKRQKFLSKGPQPWTFPITEISQAPDWYSRKFPVSQKDLVYFACDEEFMTLFAIAVQLVVRSKIVHLPYLQIILTSARELFVSSMDCPFYTQVSCVLAHVIMQYIRENKDLQNDLAYNKDAKALLALAVGCNPERARVTTEIFFVRAQTMYRKII